jgi:hypothetical protein
MKKLFIGLLVLAAGGAAFFLLNKKKNSTEVATINKTFILGKWKPISKEPATDTLQTQYQFDFLKEGIVLRAANDSTKADTTHYEWNKANELVMKESVTDSAGTLYTVVKLTADTLQVQSKTNNVSLLLTKAP